MQSSVTSRVPRTLSARFSCPPPCFGALEAAQQPQSPVAAVMAIFKILSNNKLMEAAADNATGIETLLLCGALKK